MPYHHSKTIKDLSHVLDKIKQAIYTPLTTLDTEFWHTSEPVPFSERTSGTHKTLSIGESWGKLWDCAWFHFTGTVPSTAAGKNVVLLIDLSGEAYVADDQGSPILGLTTVSSAYDFSLGRPGKNVVPFADSAQGGEKIDIWADAACNDLFGMYQDSGTLRQAHIALYNPEIKQLYYDFEVLQELMQQIPSEKARHQRIYNALSRAAYELTDYTEEEATRAHAILAVELAKTGGTPSLNISAIGHAHIDLAWLWPIRETIRKGARSFSTVLANMEQYPDYIFGASQPQLYQWMKDLYPDLYSRIKQKVAEGRWEAQGAMWVEPDTNLSSGEALVRQIVYGKQFFREEFGKDPKMLWLPDVFGYSAALPQILKKAGVDYFLTIKLSWNTFNVFPHHTFYWQGIDGTRILSHMPPEGTYNSSAAPRAIVAAEKSFADKSMSEHCIVLYGIGDGGGGPGIEHLERLQREKNLDGLAPVVQEHAETFFARIDQETQDYKTWTGELYLEKHQGTYTTQARNKRYNRKMEYALRELEFVATLANITTGASYPKQALDEIWKEVLLYQFHDILPGSSIKRVYDESLARYEILFAQTNELLQQAQTALVQQLNTSAYNQPLTIFNSLSWERTQWLKHEDRWHHITVPASGYQTLELANTHTQQPDIAPLSANPELLENNKLRVSFALDGSIHSIYDKEYEREVLLADTSANKLAVYQDEGDAWDFPIHYDEQHPRYFQLEHTQALLDGPQAIVEQTYRFNNSTLQQRIILTSDSRRLDFVTNVDWQEKHKMLRTSFPVAINASEATCDIQFGSLKRPTHRNTSWDMARYEICAHKYVDISQWDYGVALLNDCKYGHNVFNNIIDLNLLRSPNYPGEQADKAHHEFTYSLFPHTGNHIIGGVIPASYELNVPLYTLANEAHSGTLPATSTFASVDAENVIIETIKQSEDGQALILRLYESSGAGAKTTLTLNPTIKSVAHVNLMEENSQELAHTKHEIELSIKPFEILTLRITL